MLNLPLLFFLFSSCFSTFTFPHLRSVDRRFLFCTKNHLVTKFTVHFILSWSDGGSAADDCSSLHAPLSSALSNFFSVPLEFHFFFPAKKRTLLWSLERALNFLQLPRQRLAPEPHGSTLRLWSTAPKTLARLTLKVPFGALSPTPPSVSLRLHAVLPFHYCSKWKLCVCVCERVGLKLEPAPGVF